MKKLISIIAVVLLASTSLFGFSGCGGGDRITIGSKDFNENIVLGEVYAQLIEANSDIKVTRKLNLGGTFVAFEALKSGSLDIYPEYTGTALMGHLNMNLPENPDPDDIYNTVQSEFNSQFNIKWLKPHGFNNTYAIAVTRAVADEYNLKKCSDLIGVAQNLTFGAEHEFFNRDDGFEGFTELYGVAFKGEPVKMNVQLKYQAIGQGNMDVTDAFATDAEIIEYDLVVLDDDLGFFPPYYAAPIVRNATLEKYPQLEDILNKLAGIIDDETMTSLNYQVSVEEKSIEQVAKTFLQEHGLI